MKNKHSFLLIIFYFLFIASLHSMDWPVEYERLTGNFGLNNEGMPYLGAAFESTDLIRASGDGELLFRRREGDRASRLPSPLGSWTALEHNGIIGIYSRYDDSSAPDLPEIIWRGTPIAESGISGWSSHTGMYFQLFDRRDRRWINPSMIITSQDTRAPVIVSVMLRNQEGVLINPLQPGNISQGSYTVIVNANDTMLSPNDPPLAPFRITSILNDREAGVLGFENYFARDGSLMVNRNGLVPVRQVFAPAPAFEAADIWLIRGRNSLEIVVLDEAGNSRNAVFIFVVE